MHIDRSVYVCACVRHSTRQNVCYIVIANVVVIVICQLSSCVAF